LSYDVIIGVDESGTGAWAGPFTVCAAASWKRDDAELRKIGAADSKALSDKRRRRIMPELIDTIIGGACELVTAAETFNPGQAAAWRNAIALCVKGVYRLVPPDVSSVVVIDGDSNAKLVRMLQLSLGYDVPIRFRKKADVTVPAVSVASIIAKTVRNDAMLKLHKKYPQYGWDRNYGYHSAEHKRQIERLGITDEHRFIRPLQDLQVSARKAEAQTPNRRQLCDEHGSSSSSGRARGRKIFTSSSPSSRRK